MISQTVRELEAKIEPLRHRVAASELLFIEDLFVGVTPLSDDVEAFYVDGKIGDGGELTDLSPGLSFKWTAGGVERFANSDRLRKSVRDFLSDSPNMFREPLIDSDLLIRCDNADQARSLAEALAAGIELLTTGSLNAMNKYQDEIESRCSDLAATVARTRHGFGLLDLVHYIEDFTAADFGLMHLSNLWGSNRALTVLTTSSSNETLTHLAQFIGVADDAFRPEGLFDNQPFQAVSLPQTVGAEMIGNAAVWGNPLASLTPSGKRMVILPITRPLVRRETQEESGGIAAADILFTFVDTLNQAVMDVLRACVSTFSAYRYGARRFNLLAKLQSAHESDFSDQQPVVSASAKPFGELDLDDVLNEVLYTTSAHSVSLRLYDPTTRSLEAVGSAMGAYDGADAQSAPRTIAIKGNERTSVVIFTFLRGTRKMPYVYLKRISPPIVREIGGRVKTLNRTFIPPEYKEQGLQVPFLTRSLTRSEICFTLQQGKLAFGTLNIEAPFPAAFDQDIDYLTLIKSALERSYSAAGQRIDAQWLIANAARSDSVHQLWQYQEGGSFFTTEQDKVLRAIFPPRGEHALTGSFDLAAMQKRLIAWVKLRYNGTLRDQVTNMLKFDHITPGNVSALFAEASFVIARNIIQNAVKHGEPANDLIFFDDRPWFGARSTRCLRIHYRSTNEVAADLINLLGSTPIVRDDTDRVGYGMYNVGLLTRLLGGSLYFSRDDAEARLTIDVHLPISEIN